MKLNTKTLMEKVVKDNFALEKQEFQISVDASKFVDKLILSYLEALTIESFKLMDLHIEKRLTELRIQKFLDSIEFNNQLFLRISLKNLTPKKPTLNILSDTEKPYCIVSSQNEHPIG